MIRGPLLGPFWDPDWAQHRPKRRQDGTKRAIKSSKVAKTQHAFRSVFCTHFAPKCLPRRPSEAQEGSQEAPEEFQHLKKGIQNWTRILTFVEPVLEPFYFGLKKKRDPSVQVYTRKFIYVPKSRRITVRVNSRASIYGTLGTH